MSTTDVTQAGEFIELDQAVELTSRYRSTKPANEPLSLLFNKDLITTMLAAQDCAGLRVYFARDEEDKLSAVLVGVNSVGDDLIENPMVNRGFFCPPHCASSSPLQ